MAVKINWLAKLTHFWEGWLLQHSTLCRRNAFYVWCSVKYWSFSNFLPNLQYFKTRINPVNVPCTHILNSENGWIIVLEFYCVLGLAFCFYARKNPKINTVLIKDSIHSHTHLRRKLDLDCIAGKANKSYRFSRLSGFDDVFGTWQYYFRFYSHLLLFSKNP